jgi:hypothetical protein
MTEYLMYTDNSGWTRDRCQLEIWRRVAPKSSYAILIVCTSILLHEPFVIASNMYMHIKITSSATIWLHTSRQQHQLSGRSTTRLLGSSRHRNTRRQQRTYAR